VYLLTKKNIMSKNKKKLIKLTDEEISTFKQIAENQRQIPIELGRVEIEIKNLKERKTKLIALYDNTIQAQQEHTTSLVEKYGEGNLNTDTWEFTPSEK